MNVKLDAALSVRTVGRSIRAEDGSSLTTTTRRAAPLLAFCNVFGSRPVCRSGGEVLHAVGVSATHSLWPLLATASSTVSGSKRVLHVMRRHDESQAQSIVAEFNAFLDAITTTPQASQRRLVLGELRGVVASKYGFVVTLRQTKRTFYASTPVIESAAASFGSAWAMTGNASARVVILASIERTKEGNLRIVDLALQLSGSSFVPCDSSYEVEMANRLVAERRRFIKPLRLEAGDVMLPDFQLTDTCEPTAIEIYGMQGNDEYLARKKEKQALYARAATRCVEWIPPADLASVRLPEPLT
ncbi:DUF1173 family protein [Caballeronia sp. RCC_10]|uniref:DUF1173 family protein n=1 Tax=Caballeronia sp. RCC_10 TaxID=3239227 RepID=UPI00352581C1